MTTVKSYSESVEVVILHEDKVLLTKRAPTVKVAPNCWNVPAGKVDPGEAPMESAVREAWEETALKVEIVKELGKRRVESKTSEGQPITRDVFTLLAKPTNNDISSFDLTPREHSESVWVEPNSLTDTTQYESLMPALRDMLINVGA